VSPLAFEPYLFASPTSTAPSPTPWQLGSSSHTIRALILDDDAHLLQLVEKLDTPNRATSQSLVHGPPAPPPLKGQGERRRLGDVEAPSSAGSLPSDEGCGRENVGGSGGKDDVGSAGEGAS
jgi:hypothetical protein